jgi:hypothetical protein
LLRKIPRDDINQLFEISLALVQLCNFFGTIEIKPFDKPIKNLPEPSAAGARLRRLFYCCHMRTA